MKHQLCLPLVALALASCGQRGQPQQPARNTAAPAAPAPSASPTLSNAPAPQPEPPSREPAIDAKSSAAAVELVDKFVTLLNRHRFDEAYMLLGPGAPSRTQFDRDFTRYSGLEVSAGQPGDQEGAAGSIYLSVPLTVSGISEGQRKHRDATAILRRVNDVPGATEAQRHWHIERIDWGSAP